MNVDEKEVLAKLVARISAHREVRRILLFGSRATGTAGPDSDFDLCIMIEAQVDRRKMHVNLMREISSAEYSVDLLLVSEAEFEARFQEGWSVIRAVKEQGKTLYAA
jgi:predicted nucleotidyltransferase